MGIYLCKEWRHLVTKVKPGIISSTEAENTMHFGENERKNNSKLDVKELKTTNLKGLWTIYVYVILLVWHLGIGFLILSDK